MPPDDTKYIKSLKKDEKRIFDIYQELESSKDEAKLLMLVSTRELEPTDTNREGQTPLMFSVDADFSAKTIKKLIELGCEVNAKDEDGMTPLHKSYWSENSENFKMLLENGADPEIEDNTGDKCSELAQDNK